MARNRLVSLFSGDMLMKMFQRKRVVKASYI